MKKHTHRTWLSVLSMALVCVLLFGLTACGGKQTPAETTAAPASDGTTAAAVKDAPAAGTYGKIAVLRNMQNSDHTAQFFAGAIAEGEALGYTVDTYMSDQDDVKMQDLMAQALEKDYDIWIVSHANEGYQYDMVSKAVEKGIKVVCFDGGGEHVPGVTYTSQEDTNLASMSLDGMIEKLEQMGATQPIKFAEINILGMIVPFDTRHSVIEEYEKEGKLSSEIISPNLAGDTYSQIYTAVTNFLNNNPGNVGIWAASSGFLDGAVDAVADAGRDDVVFTAIDISNTELARMVATPAYYCCAAVDPYVIGMVDVRLGVLKTLGVETPEVYAFPAVNVYGADITDADSMATLGEKFDDFGWSEAYNTEEIQARRAEVAGN